MIKQFNIINTIIKFIFIIYYQYILPFKYITILSLSIFKFRFLFIAALRNIVYGDAIYGFINLAFVNSICDSSSISRNLYCLSLISTISNGPIHEAVNFFLFPINRR
eukprot:421451_1